jgi:arabinan endo-1,5-alpha-L-arabinosidase
VPAFTGAPEQLWQIDQLTDGTYRIKPKAVPGRPGLALVAIGASTPSLVPFDPASPAGRWTFRKP